MICQRFVINFGQTGDDSHLENVSADRILDKKIERLTVSAREIDLCAAFILNRLQLNINKKAEHANPGIAFIWNDERARRSRLKEPPPFETPDSSQNRSIAMQTDSEQFHQSALKTIIEQLNNNTTTMSDNSSVRLSQLLTTNQSSNTTTTKAFEQNVSNKKKTGKKFNLNQFIQDAVYPASCSDSEPEESQDDGNGNAPSQPSTGSSLLNASYQMNHVSGSSGQPGAADDLDTTLVGDALNDTIVDEEIIMNMSQRIPSLDDSLTEQDYEVLEIMRQLEEHEDANDEIEDDSALAPLTQPSGVKQRLSQKQSQDKSLFNASILQGIEDLIQDEANNACDDVNADIRDKTVIFNDNLHLDSDDDLLNEFSMAFDWDDVDQQWCVHYLNYMNIEI